MESQNIDGENTTPIHTQETNDAALPDAQEENIMDDILPNTSCIIGNLFESSEADGNSADTEGTSQNESQPESRECKNRRTARHVKRVDYRALSLAPQNAGQKRDKSESGSKLEGITTLRNKLASTTKIKDTIAVTLDNTRKELATTKEELAYTREELIQTRKMHEESEEQNRSLRENMNKLITSQKELIDDAEDSTNKLQAKNIELRKMVALAEELKEEIKELKAPKKMHIIIDSNREPIFRSLKEKLPDYAISKCDNIYTTDKLVQQMKTYKPEKKTTTVIMMGTNDLRAREYDKCINNFQELAKMTPPDTLVVQIPPQHHETDGFEKERSDMNRKLANQVITKRFNAITIPPTADEHKLLVGDGIHLSKLGANIIAEQIVRKIKNQDIRRTISHKATNEPPSPSTPPKSNAPTSQQAALLPTPKLWIKAEMSISNSYAGLIVGSKGRTIQQLGKDTDTKISIPPTKAGNRTTVIIKGLKQDVDTAKATINSILDTKSRTHVNAGDILEEIRVDSCLVGHVFGQRGDKISRIIAQTTTRINNDYHQNGDSTFIIKGKAPNVASAVRQVKKAMEEGRTANLRSERQKEKEHHRNERHEHRSNRRSDNETHSHGGRSRSPARRF